MGTAEIYAAVLAAEAIADALVVDVPDQERVEVSTMTLFVVTAPGVQFDDALRDALRATIRSQCSPRHVPDKIVSVPEIPRTLTNKILEVPVKKLLMGWEPERAASRDSMANPAAFDWFVKYAQEYVGSASR